MPGTFRKKFFAGLLSAALLFTVPAGAKYATLRPGATGQNVRDMQAALVSLGYSPSTDGVYDSETWAAVLAFQKAQGLTADGLAGDATLTALYALASQKASSASAAELAVGSSGTAVKTLQNRLTLLGYQPDQNGVFSTATRTAVLSFQQDFGLTATGRADSDTQEYLADAAEGITATAAVVTTGGTLTLRAARSTLSTALGYVPNGSTVGVVDAGSAWSLIRWHARQGYVLTAYLSVGGTVSAVTAVPTATPAPAVTGLARVQTSGGMLTLRETQSTAAASLARIAYGQTVQVLEKGDTWTLVTYAGKTGYVLTRYLYFLSNPATATPTAVPTAAAAAYARVTGGSLNLRASASAGSTSLLIIPNGASVQVLSRGVSWTRVSYNGTTGYVMTRYLNFTQNTVVTAAPTAVPAVRTATPSPTRTPAGGSASGTARVTGGRLVLRSYASTTAGSLVVIPNGATVTVLQRGAVWSQVVYGGLSGYVMSQYLTFVQTATATPVPTAAPTAVPVVTRAPTAAPTAAPAATAVPSYIGASGTAVVTVSSGGLNLRSYASTSAKALTAIPDGTTINVLERGAVWSQVAYNGFTGYVVNDYLTFIGSSWATATPTPAATAAPASSAGYDTTILTRTLRSGYTGTDVTYVQQRLQALRYLSSVSGTYDSATMEAVRLFQSVHGLTQDGIAGPKTFTALFSSSAQTYSDSLASYSTMHINYGTSEADSGSVTKMQRALSQLGYTVTVNGKFDELTHNAIVQFQMRNGLTTSGAADAATQRILYSGIANGATATPLITLGANENIMTVPDASQVQLLHWYNVVKPSLTTGSTLKILDPNTGTWWNLRVYSRGRHCDSEPLTLRDTLLMNRAFGKTGWTVHVVYVQLPDGRWTMATMHNRPHLSGTITDNGFDGHLCVHFLRDMDECKQYDPDYGVTNQTTLREGWKALTGQTVN